MLACRVLPREGTWQAPTGQPGGQPKIYQLRKEVAPQLRRELETALERVTKSMADRAERNAEEALRLAERSLVQAFNDAPDAELLTIARVNLESAAEHLRGISLPEVFELRLELAGALYHHLVSQTRTDGQRTTARAIA